MSFDLAVWFEPGPISNREAAEKYEGLCDADADARGASPTHPRVAAFYRDLLDRFPEPEAGSDPEVLARSPWAAGVSTTPVSVVISISWSRADEVADAVRTLAERHALVCYDPQSDSTRQPQPPDGEQRLTLSSCDGSIEVDPAPDRIEQALHRLSKANWYAIMERGDDWYVQVGYGAEAGARPGWYMLERRDGSADRHYGTTVSDLDQVIHAFQRYARGDMAWTRLFTWDEVQL